MGGHAIEPNTITGGLNTCGARPYTPSCNLRSPPPPFNVSIGATPLLSLC